MPTPSSINELFFQAGKTELKNNGISYNPPQFAVQGQPNNMPEVTYKVKNRLFDFVSYKKAYLGGICRASRLFRINPNNIRPQKIEHGKRFQWVLIELTQDAKTVLIAGESYQPYILIDYKYDNPTIIHYHFGIARIACTNGIISGLKFFGNQKVKTEDFSICDPFFNPCILDVLIGRYDLLFTALKKIKVNEDQFQQLFEMILGRKLNTNSANTNSKMTSSENIDNEITHFHMLSEKYSEMGNNMYRVLNMFTDYATHYYGSNYHDEENEIHQQVVSLQKKAGEFLDDLFEYFEKNNHFLINEDLSTETFGHRSINLENEANIETIINALSKNK